MRTTRTDHAGAAVTVPAGAVHTVGNTAELATYVAENGKPLLTLVE